MVGRGLLQGKIYGCVHSGGGWLPTHSIFSWDMAYGYSNSLM